MDIYPVGDMALSADFGNAIDEDRNNKVMRLERNLRKAGIPGVLETVPSYRALMVRYDPAVLSYEQLQKQIKDLEGREESAEREVTRTIIHLIPCCYGGHYGEDLAGMEKLTGLTSEEMIRIHAGTDYKIYMLGFLPGFVYLGGMDERIAVPRLDEPRVAIPAGSVGIGGKQTGVYPIASPGGWRLIGTTPVKFYDPGREKPILCSAGEYIRFIPISSDELDKIAKEQERGRWKPERVEVNAETLHTAQ